MSELFGIWGMLKSRRDVNTKVSLGDAMVLPTVTVVCKGKHRSPAIGKLVQ